MLSDWNVPFRALIDAAPDGLVVCDQNGTLVLVNAEAERMFGYAHDELRGKAVETLIPEHVRPRHQHHLASYTASPRLRPMGSNLDLRGRRKDGSEFPVEISLSPFDTERGVLIIAGVRDVTDRRHLERENKRANAYLVSAVDAVQDAFTLFDEHDCVMMVNSAARQLLGGATDASIVGRRFSDLLEDAVAAGVFDVGGESRAAFQRRSLAYHQSPVGTFEVRTSAGRHLRVTDRRTADHGTVMTIADITDDVQRAEELRQAREQAEAASAAKSEFLSSMSHELRTPLNAILGFAQLLERDRKQPLSERQLERLGHVLRGGEHLLRLIDDVLDLSRIEAGRLSLSSEPVDLVEVLTEVVHTLEPMAARARLEIVTHALPPDAPRVVADRTRLAQILMNFGSNAIKYGKPDGQVAFRTESAPGTVRITVVDNGIGIPEDKRDRIFDPFQRAGQEAGPIEGTGIGLTISKRLAELMRGRVGFHSQLGQGSEFWVELPAHVDQPAYEPIAIAGAAISSRLATGERRHTIVYVEDNPSNIAFMRELVEDLPSVELLTAPTAEIGLELIRGRLPKAVILDINLPGMSGFEALRRLREWPETRDIPVIGLSAAALARDTARAKDAGFYRYLTKPVKVDELTETLERLLEGP
ncbi:MAG: PAS domain-containing hybrid sensor histidine kinase/response regulator [bacterium]